MNKFLFGTTALAAVGFALVATPAAAQGFKSTNFDFTIGGYARQYVNLVGNQGNQTVSTAGTYSGTSDPQGFDQQSDFRLIITAATTLSSGIRVGQRIDWDALAPTSTSSSQIRRNWTFVSGGFGEFRLGSSDAVSEVMFVGAPDAFTGPTSVRDGKMYDNIIQPTKSGTSDSPFTTSIRLFDRAANKITYITPRFEGFQLGVNYTPEASQNTNGALAGNNSYRYGYAGALNYTNTLAGVAVQAYGTYLAWEKPSNFNYFIGQSAAAVKPKSPYVYGAGLNLGYMGFNLGGSWANYNDAVNVTRGNTGVASAFSNQFTIDGNGYDYGIGYTFGPAVVSLNGFYGENEAATINQTTGAKNIMTGKEKRTAYALNANYTLAPGVLVMGSLFWAKHEGNAVAGTTNVAATNKATGALGALILNF